MIKLIIDGASDFTTEEGRKLNIEVIPIRVSFAGKEYDNLSNAEFYKLLKECKTLPSTSLINEATYRDVIERVVNEGNQALVLCLSSGLSGSFTSLCSAVKNLPENDVAICDTRCVASAYRILALEAKRMIDAGLTLSEISKNLEILKEKVKIFAVIDDISYLVKGGRLSLAAGVVVSALKIKPIVTVKDGKVKMIDKVIGFNRATAKCAEYIKNPDTERYSCFLHCNCEESLSSFKQSVLSSHDFKEADVSCIGPVVGTHVGPGCIGFAYFEK